MADGISILTNLSKVGTVSRIVEGQQVSPHSQEKMAKQLDSPKGDESVLLKDVEESERARLRRRSEERRRRRKQEDQKREADETVGGHVDFKV